MSWNPKRDARILAMLRRGYLPKEVAFKLKLSSASIVYELLRSNRLSAYSFRRRSVCKRLPKFSA